MNFTNYTHSNEIFGDHRRGTTVINGTHVVLSKYDNDQEWHAHTGNGWHQEFECLEVEAVSCGLVLRMTRNELTRLR